MNLIHPHTSPVRALDKVASGLAASVARHYGMQLRKAPGRGREQKDKSQSGTG
jgi:hypothetical protein